MDPKSKHIELGPDPKFWPNLELDPGLFFFINFEETRKPFFWDKSNLKKFSS